MTQLEEKLVEAIKRAEKHIHLLAYKLGADEDEAKAATKYLRDALKELS